MTMTSKCSNPDCQAPFDYRFGRFFRFHQRHAASEGPANSHSVCHYWLCRRCSESYTLEERAKELFISPRFSNTAARRPVQQRAGIPI